MDTYASSSLRSPDLGEGSTTRSLSLINAARPPQNRKRVWRACKWCKKKKAKCDGAEPCQSCINNSVDCVYPEDSGTGSGTGAQLEYVQRLEDRLLSMESMFRAFMESNSARGETSDVLSSFAEQQSSPMKTPKAAQAAPTSRQGEALDIPRDQIASARQAVYPAVPDHSQSPAAINHFVADRIQTPRSTKPSDKNDGVIFREVASTKPLAEMDKTSLPYCNKRHHDRYADEFGILEIDATGELRYAGSQATVNIFNTCHGLRSHIRSGLRKKGYEGTESYWSSPSETADPTHRFHGTRHTWTMPPSNLVDILVARFYSRLYCVFPMVQQDDFQKQYDQLKRMETGDDDFIPVLFAILALSAPMLSLDDPVFDQPDCAQYRQSNLGIYFYSVARNALDNTHYTVVTLGALTSPLGTQKNSINKVMALGLLAAYLAGTGNEAEAWTTVGSVVRLGQDLGLHRSPEKLRLPESEWQRRRCVWLCLYVLDRLISISLGRQLAINDSDCDITLPDQRDSISPENNNLAGFFALVRLLRISGEVISMTNSVSIAQPWRQSAESLRQRVHDLAAALRKWARDSVPPQVKHATRGQLLTERCVLLGAFFASVMLLHRPFMSNPHRESPLGNADTVIQCARAAVSCIGTTSDCLASIPPSQFLSLYGQQVFVSCVLLMHCMRVSKDELSKTEALGHVESGMAALQALERDWCGALKCRGVLEEFLEFTLDVLQTGNRGRCYFDDDDQSCDKISTQRRVTRTDSHCHYHRHLHTPATSLTTFNPNTTKKRKTSAFELASSSPRFGSHNRQAFASNTSPHHVGQQPTITANSSSGFAGEGQLASEEAVWGGEIAWLSDGDLLSRDIFGSEDHLSPFLQMNTVMESHGDVWNVL